MPQAAGQQGQHGILGGRLCRHRLAGHANAGGQIIGQFSGDHGEEVGGAQGANLGLGRHQIADQLATGCGVGGIGRHRQPCHHRHVASTAGACRRREGHEVIGTLVEGILEARGVIERHPYLTIEQRFLHEAVGGGAWIGHRPDLAELLPHGHGIGAAELAHHRMGEGGIEIAFQEAVDQPLATGREAQLGLAGGGLEIAPPGQQLVIAQCIEIRAFGQVGQRLAIGRHDVGGLHPGDVALLLAAQLAQRQVLLADALVLERACQRIQWRENAGRQRAQLAMQAAEQVQRAFGTRLLRLQS